MALNGGVGVTYEKIIDLTRLFEKKGGAFFSVYKWGKPSIHASSLP